MIRNAFDRLTLPLLLLLAAFGIASCGSGAVSGPAPVVDPTRITILPATATLFSGNPTTFTISGGTGSYIVSSSNQQVIPVSGAIASGSLVITPNAVAVDTPVTLTVRDTGTTPVATAELVVRPGTVNNEITITPSPTQGGNCAPAICSGSDAVVSARIAQGGQPLPGRGVRFEVVSGDFFFITSAPGLPETLAASITVVSDEAGRAQARIRVTAVAQNQTALLQVTDLSSGAFQRTPIVIAQATNNSPGFFAAPQSITFTGPNTDECAGSGASASIFVFGGTPPYRVSNASAGFTVNREVLNFSGDSFTIFATGACVAAPGLPIVVTDAAGRTTTILAANVVGTRVVPPLTVAPASVSLSSCEAVAAFAAGGGSGNYIATPGSGSIFVGQSGNLFSVGRTQGPATTSPLNVGISDGRSVVNVTVNLTGAALGQCPPGDFTATPTAVTLNDCVGAAQVTLSGGSGTYTAASRDTRVSATVNGNIVSIRRVANTTGISSTTPVFVTVSDGVGTPIEISVTSEAGSPAAGTCT